MKIHSSQLLIGFSGIAVMHTFSECSSEKENQKALRPNIIYIMADDLGYGDLGCFGQKLIKTPNLDQMGANGIRFSQHYCGTSVSAPSRCCLMTGMHCGHAYIRGNRQGEPYGQLPIPDSIVTVAELMKQAGYTTGLFGKWGLGVENTSGDPQKQGIDEFYGYYCQLMAHNSFPPYLFHNGQKEMLRNEVKWSSKDDWTKGMGSIATKRIDYSNDFFFSHAIDFIEKNKDKPFFLYLPTTIPHSNGEEPEGKRNESPTLAPYQNEKWTDDQKAYAAEITRMDSCIGEIVAKLKQLHLDSNTLVIFTSDNGADSPDIFENNGGLRGIKRDLYEGGLREPFVAFWPGKIQPGSVSEHISAFWDFMPTACELAGVEPPKNTDGISYVNALQGKEQKKHEFLYWEIMDGNGPKQALRMDNWKAVINNAGNINDTIELYDLSTDLYEKNNVASQHPEIVTKMNDIINKEHTPSPIFKFKKEEK
jgi:arylsulfatase A